jgi:integrase/recombinase XerD
VYLLHSTGARISNILAFDLSDVDLQNWKFQVIGKRNKQRWCFYSENIVNVLTHYLKYYRHPSISALFTAQQPFTKEVPCLSYATAHKSLVDLIDATPELQGIRFHDLRHTFGTEQVGLMAIHDLRALMGHETIQITLR